VNYNTDDGLIDNSVNYVAIDLNDDVWFGTQNGISQFNGNNWTNYSTANSPGLVNNNINSIAFESDNSMWVGSDFGVSRFDGNTWTSYDQNSGLADNRVKHIFIDNSDVVWVANSDGVSVYDGHNWWSLTSNDGIPFGGVSHIAEDVKGNLIFSTPLSGILIFDGVDISTVNEMNGLISNRVRSSSLDNDNNIWIATADGISVLDSDLNHIKNHTRVFELPPPDTLNPIEDIKVDSKGKVWAAVYVDYLVTEGGVSSYSGFQWSDLDVNDGLVGPVVRNLAIDKNDNVWVATSTGLSHILSNSTSTEGTAFAQMYSIYPNPASDFIIIDSDMSWKNLHVYDMHGRTSDVKNVGNRIDLTSLLPGIYFLQITSQDGQSALMKFIVN
jgi:ligand-binding sensor domain-containing protein